MDTVNFKPLNDLVLVKRDNVETKTKTGILLVEGSQEKPQKGTVIAVGKGRILNDGTLVPLEVKEGDNIIFGKWTGSELTIEGESFIIMKETDILGIV